MKRIQLFLILAIFPTILWGMILFTMFFIGCAATSTSSGTQGQKFNAALAAVEPCVRTATAFICLAVVEGVVDDDDIQQTAVDLRGSSELFAQLGSGESPTVLSVDQFSDAIGQKFSAEKYAVMVEKIGTLYSTWYPEIKGNPKLYTQLLGDLAGGVLDASNMILKSKQTSTGK